MAGGGELSSMYNSFIESMPGFLGDFINLLILVLLIFIYGLFVWKLYKFISKKNFLNLNFEKYTESKGKFMSGLIYFVEYLIISPFILFFAFGIFTIFLIVLTRNLEISTLLIISAAVIATARMASYYKQDLAEEIAKILPLTLLGVAIVTPGFFDVELVFTQLGALPEFFSKILTYLGFIIILEAVLRFFEFIFSLFGLTTEEEVTES